MGTTQLLIVADDLSGALDCALEAAQGTFPAKIRINTDCIDEATPLDATSIWAIDTNSRHCTTQEAITRCNKTIQQYKQPNQIIYKKIDSTLRGNFPAVIANLIPLLGVAIIAPAYPDMHRTTVEGHQLINDKALSKTVLWQNKADRGNIETSIVELMHSKRISSALVTLATIREGITHVRNTINKLMTSKVRAIVCDAQTNSDLTTIAQACINLAKPHFFVGSAGLARYIPEIISFKDPPQRLPLIIRGPILLIAGSASQITQQQIQHLTQTRPVTKITVSATILSIGQHHPQWISYRHQLIAALQQGHDVALKIKSPTEPPGTLSHSLSTALTQLLDLSHVQLGAIICTGGETCHNLLTQNHAREIALVGKIESGVPVSLILGKTPIPFVTKAGAFGTEQTLTKSYDYLVAKRTSS